MGHAVIRAESAAREPVAARLGEAACRAQPTAGTSGGAAMLMLEFGRTTLRAAVPADLPE